MNKKRLIISILATVLVIIGVTAFFCLKNNKKDKKETETIPVIDAIRFKQEYESLNNTVRESDGANYNNVTIPEDNPIKYVNTTEALEVLKNKTGILYVGASWCPWCRNAIPVLLDVAREKGIKTIYYLNLDDEKSNWKEIDGKAIKTGGTEGYYALLDYLKDYLRDYFITVNNKQYDTKEKRIYMPYLIAFKDGKVVSTYSPTSKLNDGQSKYDDLTDKQYQDLLTKTREFFEKVYNNADCDEECS